MMLLLALAAGNLAARVRLVPLFTDGMVLQQQAQVPVWGEAAPGASVLVTPSWNGKTSGR